MSVRSVIDFSHAQLRFTYRVAAVIVARGHVLVCREDDDPYTMLPGGRVEMGEPSALALARELAEELAQPAEIGPLLATYESFYSGRGEAFHEIGTLYKVDLPGQGPGGAAPWLVREDEGHVLSFYWVPLDDAALAAMTLLPPWLPAFLRAPPQEPAHIVFDEREPA